MWRWLGLSTYPSYVIVQRNEGWETCHFTDSNFGTDMRLLLTEGKLSLVPSTELGRLQAFQITGGERDF